MRLPFALALTILLCLLRFAGAGDNPATATNASPISKLAAIQRNGSPVDYFRELLAMTPAERKSALTNRSPENQKALLAKVREYEGMKPDQREWRLKATELRWYLTPLMRSPATNREAQLTKIPEADRQMVADHIQQWDALTDAAREEMLRHQDTIRYLFYSETNLGSLYYFASTNLSQARVRKLEQGVREWQSLPDNRRQELLVRFEQFFELSPLEKRKSLNTLSEAERRQIEKTLKAFNSLTPAQRTECIRSFEKFAEMTLFERQQFLKNAEKWKLMKPEERAAWKTIVDSAPTQPQGTNIIRRPHLPKIVPRKPVVATNGGQ